jgi:hypothetical protein
MIKKIGVTGTRNGMTDFQKERVSRFLQEIFNEKAEFHHGDCVGVDVETAEIAKSLGYYVVNHPPVDESLRAFHKSDKILEPKTHFARNRDIVDDTDLLVVVPRENEHQSRGGTWYTHDYAVKKNKPVLVFYPERGMKIMPISWKIDPDQNLSEVMALNQSNGTLEYLKASALADYDLAIINQIIELNREKK